MESFAKQFVQPVIHALENLPTKNIAHAINILQATYERDGKVFVCGNGGSFALASHWVGDFNKTAFNHHLEGRIKRFQAIRLPSSEAELTAWANDMGYDMVFAGPLQNYIQDSDALVAISSSGNSENII